RARDRRTPAAPEAPRLHRTTRRGTAATPPRSPGTSRWNLRLVAARTPHSQRRGRRPRQRTSPPPPAGRRPGLPRPTRPPGPPAGGRGAAGNGGPVRGPARHLNPAWGGGLG